MTPSSILISVILGLGTYIYLYQETLQASISSTSVPTYPASGTIYQVQTQYSTPGSNQLQIIEPGSVSRGEAPCLEHPITVTPPAWGDDEAEKFLWG